MFSLRHLFCIIIWTWIFKCRHIFPTYLSEWFFLLKRIFIILRKNIHNSKNYEQRNKSSTLMFVKMKRKTISVDVVLLSLFYENSTLWYCNTHCIFKIQGQKELSIKPFTFKKIFIFIFRGEFSGGLHQTSVLSSINNSSHAAYKKLLNTAYKLAMTPSMPYEHFKVLVKCQRKNGVHLIQGCDNGRATRGFVSHGRHCERKSSCNFSRCQPHCQTAHKQRKWDRIWSSS